MTNFKNYVLVIKIMANYDALKASVAKNGEVMIRLDTGEKIELHIHNVKFDDTTKEVVVDAACRWSPGCWNRSSPAGC